MHPFQFKVETKDPTSFARTGLITTAHGNIETPIFMPVGTRAAVKTLTEAQLKEIGAQIILGNTYHLMLKPGCEVIEKAQGLHKFMNWDRPILTDSGGFQVFSLSSLNKLTEDGVHFQSHIDGSRWFLGPKESMQVQKTLGSDIVMCFDECTPYPCPVDKAAESLKITLQWAQVCRDFSLQPHQALFGIVQGSVYPQLREKSAKELVKIGFEGYAIGGLSVGEPAEEMYKAIDVVCPHLPVDKPRYLMGVGTPRNIVEAVKRGIDMFDCVMPTRNARNGTAFTWQGKINIKAARYSQDFSPLDPELDSYASKFSKAYIRHLISVEEVTGMTLITMQNLAFYLDFMKQLRQSIRDKKFNEFYERICALYPI